MPKRRRRSSSTISPETQLDMDKEDLKFLVPKKRMRSVMSLQVCAARTGAEGEFKVEIGDVAPQPVAKITSLRSPQLLVSKISISVIGAKVPKKTRSACVKRLVDEYPASDCYNYPQYSNLGTGESEEPRKLRRSISSIKLSTAVNEDLEMEVAEVLLGLNKQSQQPDYARNSLLKPGVSHVKESDQIKEDVKVWSVKNKVGQVEISKGSEIKLLENHNVPDRLGNLDEDDVLVNEIRKEKPFLLTGDGLAFESRKFADMKVIQMAPLPECEKSKSDILLRKVSQNGRKRCATHFYIAQSIMNPLQSNKVNFLSSAAGSASSIENGSIKKDVNERSLEGHILNGDVAPKSSNVKKSRCPQGKEASTVAPCLPYLARRKHPDHEAPQVASSENKMYQMVGLKSELSGTYVSTNSHDSASLIANASSAGGKTGYSTFSMMDPTLNLYNSHPVTSEGSPFMTMIPSNDYAFPISTTLLNSSSFKGGLHGHVMPYFNGAVYSPQMFYPPLLSQQPNHPQTPILSPTHNNTQLSHPLSSHKQLYQHQKNRPDVSAHNFLPSATVQSQSSRRQHVQPRRQSHKHEDEIADKKPLVDNLICGGQRSAHNQHSQAPLHHMHLTKSSMVARSSNMRRLEKQELVQGPMVRCELPTSQSVSMSYSPFGGSSDVSETGFSLPAENFPLLLPSPLVTHQRCLVPKIPDIVKKYYQGGGRAGVNFKGADSARNGFTGKTSSCLSQSCDISKAIPYDQTGLVKGFSMFDRLAKNLSSYTASMGTSSGSHYGIQQHHAQGIWNGTSNTNGQSLPHMSTRASLSPAIMSSCKLE